MSRADRVRSLLKREIAAILQTKVNDSRLGFVSITDIELSKDMAYVKVFYSVFGSEKEKEKTKAALTSAAPFIRSELGKVIRLQQTPELRFIPDDSLERGVNLVNKIDNLF